MPRGRAASAAGNSGNAVADGFGFPFAGIGAGAGASGGAEGQSPERVIRMFLAQLAQGRPWHLALLEAMGRWIPAEEWRHNRRYKYMVGGEAFDWLLLAERLCAEALDCIPQQELERLLFHGLLPEPETDDEFRELLGVSKHRAYLNYHYGVVLEEALQLAAEEYARKRHMARGYSDSEDVLEEAFRHLYAAGRAELLAEFREKARLGSRQSLNLSDLKEFTYWLHKRRVNYWDPARVAYDTRVAILKLSALQDAAAISADLRH